MFTKVTALALASKGIRCNALNPGIKKKHFSEISGIETVEVEFNEDTSRAIAFLASQTVRHEWKIFSSG